jgi:hypothetical protein
MIQPDARSRLTPEDIALVLRWTWGQAVPRDEVELWLEAADLDELLDRPELADRMRTARGTGPSIPSISLFFYVLVRQALLRRGLNDRRMADYCAALLREFGLRDRAHRIAAVDDHRHRYLVDILSDLAASQGDRQFTVLVHLGNYALWTAGVFPAWIESRRDQRGGPDLSYYDALGTRGFAEASDHWLASRVGLEDVLRTAAEQFGEVRGALNDVSERIRLRAA